MSDELKLEVGKVYRAKNPRAVLKGFGHFVNDRQIIHIGAFVVKYDSPSVGFGRRYPEVSKAEFLKWAERQLTKEEAGDDWIQWSDKREANK